MTRKEKEVKKKAGQALLIAEFPQVCRARINRTGPEYDPSAYWRLITLSWAAIISKLGRGSPPKIRKEWKAGLEVDLKQAWDAELTKIKEDALKIAQEKIPRVCKVKVNLLCTDVIYPILTEDTFNSVVSLAFSDYYSNTVPESWKKDLRGDVTEAWDAEVEKAKADGRIPKTLEDAFQIAWAYMVRTKPFEHHDWISEEGLRYAILNLISGYPKSQWLSWPGRGWNRPNVFILNSIPESIKENLQALHDEINARGR